MDQIKIGKFIAELRKEQKLTQNALAERFGVSDRAVSKWETGRSLPDPAIILDLCRTFGISVDKLFCGERIMEEKDPRHEELLLELARQKVESDRQLLSSEIFIGLFSVILLISFTFAASFFEMETWLRITLIVTGFLLGFVGCFWALRLEQIAGFYECRACRHRYVPSYTKVLFAMHANRTRYMKCPKCGKYTWQKKRLTKDE